MACQKCGDTGVIKVGNNDIPCECPSGDTVEFYAAGVFGRVTGVEVRRHFLQSSPEPLGPEKGQIRAADLPGRQKV
jgi:hypothetical protein